MGSHRSSDRRCRRPPPRYYLHEVLRPVRLNSPDTLVSVAVEAGFKVVREYVGHGIGTAMHEEPPVPNYGQPGRGVRIKEGYVLAIEPMVNQGKPETETLDDGWTVVTRDGSLSAHFEHTIAVTDHGPEVLTLP